MARRLTLHGASEQDTAQIRNLLRSAKSEIRSGWNLYAGEDTDFLIVDVDTLHGHMDWLRMLGLGIPVAALTEHARFEDSELTLHKPIAMKNLADLLERAAAQTRDRPEPATIRAMRQPLLAVKPVPRTTPTEPEAAASETPIAATKTVSPATDESTPQAKYLLQWLAEGKLEGRFKLNLADKPALLLDFDEKQFYTDAGLRALAPHCAATFDAAQWKALDAEAMASARDSLKSYPLPQLIWLCHALGSNGHPGDELDANAHYKLARWPQIEREFPKHFRIATEMIKQPATLTEISERSGATLAEVIDFTNAYNSIGYIEAQPAPAKPDGAAERGAIFSRLRKTLGNRQSG